MNLASIIIGALAVLVAFGVRYRQLKTIDKRQENPASFPPLYYLMVPKIGTSVKIDKRQENPASFPPFYYLIATIYNEGELPAKQLNGHCKLFSPVNESLQRTIPISKELLGSLPFELEAGRLDGIFIAADRPHDARFNCDIEFDYFGRPADKLQHYTAKYEYDGEQQNMRKVQ